MSRPVIKEGDLTYVCVTNAKSGLTEIHGTTVTSKFTATSEPQTYPNAKLGRPSGREDFDDDPIMFSEDRHDAPRPATVAQNEAAGLIGIYVLQNP